MNFKNFTKNKFVLIIPLVIFISLIGITGCDDSGVATEKTTTPQGNDSDVVSYPDLSVTYNFSGSNDTSFIAVNLWTGRLERDISSTKDMTLRDSVNTFRNFYFRSGDLSVDVPGFETRFYKLYNNYTQAEFDSLKSIDAGATLDSLDFTWNDTRGVSGDWGYFNDPLTAKPVYSFYLKGKFANGVTTKRIYGIIYFKQATLIPSSTFTITFDVRLNKNGDNWFKKP